MSIIQLFVKWVCWLTIVCIMSKKQRRSNTKLWCPSITDLTISAINYNVNCLAASANDVLVPLNVDVHNPRRSKEDITCKNKAVMCDEVSFPATEFNVVDFDDVYTVYKDGFDGTLNDSSTSNLFNRLTRSHQDFAQFVKLQPVLELQDRSIFGMYMANITNFNPHHPIYIGDWFKPEHPFLSNGFAIYGNESWACRIVTLGHAMLADQERYKQVMYACVLEYEQFAVLEGSDRGDFSDEDYVFYCMMRERKIKSSDAFFRDAVVRDLFLKYAAYILSCYRGTRFTDVVSAEIQNWCWDLMRVNCKVSSSIIGTYKAHMNRRVFDGKSGVNKKLLENCMVIFNIIDQDIQKSNYYSCIFNIFKQILWGDYVDGIQWIKIQGFAVKFEEKQDNQFGWGIARVLTKTARNKNQFYMFVSILRNL